MQLIDGTCSPLCFGGIDVLLNITGVFEWRTVAESDIDLWLHLDNANVLTIVNASRVAHPLDEASFGDHQRGRRRSTARHGTARHGSIAPYSVSVLRLEPDSPGCPCLYTYLVPRNQAQPSHVGPHR